MAKTIKRYLVLALAVYSAALTSKCLVLSVPRHSEPAPAAVAIAEPVAKPVAKTFNKTGIPTQKQKEQTETACSHVADNRQGIYGKYVSRGQFMTECYYTLLAMASHESSFDCSRVGDDGKSRGCFQIQTKLHEVTVENAEDYAFAAEWTIDRMVRDYNFPAPYWKTYAIQAHNGIVMISPGHMKKTYALAVIATAKEYKAKGL